MISQQKIDTLVKLMALADSGEGHEAQSAGNMLVRLLGKYGISREELGVQAEQTVFVEFKYKTRLEKQLIFQVCGYVCQEKFTTFYQVKRNAIELELPAHHAERCQSAYATFLKHWREFYKNEGHLLLGAFCQKHNLFAPSNEYSSGQATHYSREEIQRILNLSGMLDDIALTDEDRMIAPTGIEG
ncbi:MAG: hypothetical protein AAF702_49640 [Chloroflexota bacterium]